jgi:uncharacterized DUF497 family protein
MDIVFDTAKSNRNLEERGFDFVHAAQIFRGRTIEWVDPRHYGEIRTLAVGAVENDILTVVYTMRGKILRIISARKANKKERKLWLKPE